MTFPRRVVCVVFMVAGVVRRKQRVSLDYPAPAHLHPGSEFMFRDLEGWLSARREWYRDQGQAIRAVITPLDWLRENRAARGHGF